MAVCVGGVGAPQAALRGRGGTDGVMGAGDNVMVTRGALSTADAGPSTEGSDEEARIRLGWEVRVGAHLAGGGQTALRSGQGERGCGPWGAGGMLCVPCPDSKHRDLTSLGRPTTR